jgi:hypothetical protein
MRSLHRRCREIVAMGAERRREVVRDRDFREASPTAPTFSNDLLENVAPLSFAQKKVVAPEEFRPTMPWNYSENRENG